MIFWPVKKEDGTCCCTTSPDKVLRVTIVGCNGLPLEGATVTATHSGTPYSALTNSLGVANIAVGPDGSYTLSVSHPSPRFATTPLPGVTVSGPLTINTLPGRIAAARGFACADWDTGRTVPDRNTVYPLSRTLCLVDPVYGQVTLTRQDGAPSWITSGVQPYHAYASYPSGIVTCPAGSTQLSYTLSGSIGGAEAPVLSFGYGIAFGFCPMQPDVSGQVSIGFRSHVATFGTGDVVAPESFSAVITYTASGVSATHPTGTYDFVVSEVAPTGDCARVPIRIDVTTDTGASPVPPQPAANVTVTAPGADEASPPAADPIAGPTGPGGGFDTSVPAPPPGDPPVDYDVTITLPGYPGVGDTVTISVPPPTTDPPTPIVVPIVLTPPPDSFPFPPVSLDPVPDPLPVVPGDDPIFGGIGETPIDLPRVPGVEPPAWEGCAEDPDEPGTYVGLSVATTWAVDDPYYTVAADDPYYVSTGPAAAIGEPLTTVTRTSGTGDCTDPPDEVATPPIDTGTPVPPAYTTAPPVVVVGPTPCRSDYPDTLSITLGPETAFNYYAGRTYTLTRNRTAPGIRYSAEPHDALPWCYIDVVYTVDAAGTPTGTAIFRLGYPGFVGPPIALAAPPMASLCPLDTTFESVTPPATAAVVEPTPATAVDMLVGHYFLDNRFSKTKFIHIQIWDAAGRSLIKTTSPLHDWAGGVVYHTVDGSFGSYLSDVGMYSYEARVSGLEPGREYLIRSYSSPRSGYATGNGPRTLLTSEVVRLYPTRIALRGCGFDGPAVGVVADELGATAEPGTGRSYQNTTFGGGTVAVEESGSAVAAGTITRQGYVYLDLTPNSSLTYDLEVTLPSAAAASGYPAVQAFSLSSDTSVDPEDEPQVFRFELPATDLDDLPFFAIPVSSGIDVRVEGCGCGLAGAATTLERRAVGGGGSVLESMAGTTPADGRVHFAMQVVDGHYTLHTSKSGWVSDTDGQGDTQVLQSSESFGHFPCGYAYRSIHARESFETVLQLTMPSYASGPYAGRLMQFCQGGDDPILDVIPDSVSVTLGVGVTYFGPYAGVMFDMPRSGAGEILFTYSDLVSSPTIQMSLDFGLSGSCDPPSPVLSVQVGIADAIDLTLSSGTASGPIAFTVSGGSPTATATVAE